MFNGKKEQRTKRGALLKDFKKKEEEGSSCSRMNRARAGRRGIATKGTPILAQWRERPTPAELTLTLLDSVRRSFSK